MVHEVEGKTVVVCGVGVSVFPQPTNNVVSIIHRLINANFLMLLIKI
jgi:hypothetical protein